MGQSVSRTRWPWVFMTSLGALIVVLSFLWTLIFPVTQEWTAERAEEYREVGLRLHNLTIEARTAGRNPATRERETVQLESLRSQHHETQRRWEELRDELESTQKRGQSTATILRLIGAGLAVLGMVGWLATRPPN